TYRPDDGTFGLNQRSAGKPLALNPIAAGQTMTVRGQYATLMGTWDHRSIKFPRDHTPDARAGLVALDGAIPNIRPGLSFKMLNGGSGGSGAFEDIVKNLKNYLAKHNPIAQMWQDFKDVLDELNSITDIDSPWDLVTKPVSLAVKVGKLVANVVKY